MRAYPDTLTNAQFVDNLAATAGVTLSPEQRQSLVTAMNGGATRDYVLQKIIEDPGFKQGQYNSAFVLMQYFGYLRRDPDQAGYSFWLNVLNSKEPNNYRGMVCSFITSAEYQLRFASAITRTNVDCRG
jgi:hypothetical protein